MRSWHKYKMWLASALGVLIVVASATLAALSLLESRRVALKDAEVAAEKLALVVEQNIARTFETYMLSIDGAVRVLESGAVAGLSPKLQRLMLFDNAAQASGLGSIVVLSPRGQIVFDSKSETPRPGDFSDREYFKVLKEADLGLYITAPFVSRLDDAWSVALSRRVNNADGSFAGIVTGTIKLSDFRKLFESLASGNPNSTISLFRTDGTALVRMPHVDAEIGRNYSNVGVFQQLKIASHGTFDQVAVRDNVARRYVYGQVGTLPLVFSIGLSFDDVLRGWHRKAMLLSGLGFAILGMMAGLAWMLARELSRRKIAEQKAAAAAGRFEQLANNSNDAIVLRDALGNRLYASPKFYEFLGRAPEEVGGARLQAYLHPSCRLVPTMTIRRLLMGEPQVSETLQCIRPDGSSIWLESVSRLLPRPDDQVSEILTNIRDVTSHKLHNDETERQKEEFEVLAKRDALTGIANRRAFEEALRLEMDRAIISQRPLSALMIDVDHFKLYNDNLGHAAGDEALKAVAACVDSVARRPPDIAARFGGEEFVLLLPGTDLSGARLIAERLREAIRLLALPHPTGGTVSVSIGAASSSPAHATIDLLQAADQALYAAKAAGRDRVETFAPQMVA